MTDEERREREKFFTPEESITFNMLDKGTINKLICDGDVILPHKDLDKIKDERWNTKQLTSKLLQGILNGDSIPKIAKSLTDIIGNNKASAERNARTMVTGAENAGRLDSYKDLDSQGVVQKKVWMATPDDRTRKSHIDIDGEEQDIKDEFSNKCMYPGDPAGPADEVWNCRCSMRDHIIGFRRADGSISKVNYDRGSTMHDEQMNELKERNVKQSSVSGKDYRNFKNSVKKENLKYVPVNELSKPLTDNQIIKKISQEDNKGSCASVTLAYCANKIGLDVTDFRGGDSLDFFAKNYHKMFKLADAKVKTYKFKKEVSDVADLINKIEINKQFILSAGKHMTIVKRTKNGGFSYLELQDENGGWAHVGRNREKIEQVLKERFKCTKTIRKNKETKKIMYKTVMVVDVDSFKKTDGFKDALGYLNTK